MADTASNEMVFDITMQEIPVTIGKDKYVLREADGDATCKWQNKMFRATKLNEEGKPVGLDNVADVEPYFLSLCLFPVVNGEVSDKPVPETIIGGPSAISLTTPFDIKVQANGSTIKGYRAGVELLSVTDTSITTGTRAGINGWWDNVTATVAELDDWTAADLIGATARQQSLALRGVGG